MSRFEQANFSVGANDAEAQKKYAENFDKSFKKKKALKLNNHKIRIVMQGKRLLGICDKLGLYIDADDIESLLKKMNKAIAKLCT